MQYGGQHGGQHRAVDQDDDGAGRRRRNVGDLLPANMFAVTLVAGAIVTIFVVLLVHR